MILASSPLSNLHDVVAATLYPNQPTATPSDVKISYSTNPFGDSTAELRVTAGRATIRISEDMDGTFAATINDVIYPLDINNSRGNTLVIKTDRFDDTLIIEDSVKTKTNAYSGPGDDYVRPGDRRSKTVAGEGNDEVYLGAEGGLAYGEDGDDKLYGGGIFSILEGGPGNNTLATSTDALSTTFIKSSGIKDTISALAGRVDIHVSGGADIHVASDLDRSEIHLGENSTGSNITLDGSEDRANDLTISGLKEGRDTVHLN